MNFSEQSILADVAKNELNTGIRRKAVKRLREQSALADVAKNDRKTDIRIIALKRLTDQSAIAEIAMTDRKTDVRRMAVRKLTNQSALADVAVTDRKTDIRKMALKKMNDPVAVFSVAKNDHNANIRKIALKKLRKLTGKIGMIHQISQPAKIYSISEKSNAPEIVEKIEIVNHINNSDHTAIDIFAKIDSAINEINLLNNSIDDEIISYQTTGIKSVLVKMAAFLKEEENIGQRVNQLDQFLDYYFPTVKKIFDSYRQITEHKLDGDNALGTKKRIAGFMPVIRKAFEKELDNMYENKMLDVTTDIDVLEAMLAQDGILDTHKFT